MGLTILHSRKQSGRRNYNLQATQNVRRKNVLTLSEGFCPAFHSRRPKCDERATHKPPIRQHSQVGAVVVALHRPAGLASGSDGAVAILASDLPEGLPDGLGAAQVGVSGVHNPDEHHEGHVDCRNESQKDLSRNLRCSDHLACRDTWSLKVRA